LRLFLFGLLSAVVVTAAFLIGRFASPPSPLLEKALVTRVIDGDTVQLQDGEMVRYIGIDAPETVDPNEPVGCFGPEASARNKELVEGKYVELMSGAQDRDEYGRLLRYVFVDGIFVNAELITEGYARQFGYGDERRFQQVFVQLEQYSIGRKSGLWGACPQ
jgi:micrococcal nuclease